MPQLFIFRKKKIMNKIKFKLILMKLEMQKNKKYLNPKLKKRSVN